MNAHDSSIPSAVPPNWLRVVPQKVETLRHGVAQLVVHDGRVTQIERTEKTRLGDQRRRDGSF